jgi:hypothetical protein
VRQPEVQPLLENRLDIHDQKQFELKVEYQPSGTDPDSKYSIDAWLFLPGSLNIDQDTYPRLDFYSDLHNYLRLKTPVLSFDEMLTGRHSPLYELEERIPLGMLGPESELLYDAKMLACVFRGTLRRFRRGVRERCATLASGAGEGGSPGIPPSLEDLDRLARSSVQATRDLLRRYRACVKALEEKYPLSDKCKAALRFVDEFMSLTVEKFLRRTVVEMDQMPRSGLFTELRKALMDQVLDEEKYRKEQNLRSVLTPQGDNEEYTHRFGILKKYCMNILFLKVRRTSARKTYEEMFLAAAAGLAMIFATAVAFFAQSRYSQASFNFLFAIVVGYMFKDRIKELARGWAARILDKHFFERKTTIQDPATGDDVGVCREKVEYGAQAAPPAEVTRLRQSDDLQAICGGELSETVIHYKKEIDLESDVLPRMGSGIVAGVTDIIRFNVERLLRDMDDPEYALEYVDLEDFSVEKLRAVKTYPVDVALKFYVDDGEHKRARYQLVRLVLDRNGIRRMVQYSEDAGPILRPV